MKYLILAILLMSTTITLANGYYQPNYPLQHNYYPQAIPKYPANYYAAPMHQPPPPVYYQPPPPVYYRPPPPVYYQPPPAYYQPNRYYYNNNTVYYPEYEQQQTVEQKSLSKQNNNLIKTTKSEFPKTTHNNTKKPTHSGTKKPILNDAKKPILNDAKKPILNDAKKPILTALKIIVKDNKTQFIDKILPLIIKKNEQILVLRNKVKKKFGLAEQLSDLPQQNQQWLHNISQQYRMKFDDKDILSSKKELLMRINIVDPALALAQAALESGWGSSRFSRDANNIFGIWTYDKSKGILPSQREAGKKHYIRIFSDYSDSISHYMFNLNTHSAYESFRLLRQLQMKTSGKNDILELTNGLEKYSEQGQQYIERVKNLIRSNHLIKISRQYLETTDNDKNMLAQR